ncbi:fbd-associated F-box protein at3g49020 [Phtheirospermum japonicum]|uniref:Fbd-associated F-box protein at3g49020 n=1 Tax=Phtheirospermum japonicum TaxID=374723 RepID=A0A830C4G9_9LAMI|nr:fbd-associated F-box protein at3g49020 [Phtheirospermum japonicum]
MLPQCIFNSKTLVNLCLLDCVCNPSTGAVSLPCLKSLNLYRIQYQVKKSLPHLLSGCPVLEELIVGGIADDDLNCFKIASTTIKSLSLDIGSGNVGNVKINAPALRYLEVEEYSSYEHIRLLPVSNLIEADIWLNNFVLEVDDLNFLNSLSNVNRLKLSGRVEQVCI